MKSLFLLTPFTVIAMQFCGKADLPPAAPLSLDEATKNKALEVLREGLKSDDFWPAIHAAEGLTLAGHGDEVIAYLKPKLGTETDDQKRCGIARELIRAGDNSEGEAVMAAILKGDDDHGHIHAAESLYKVFKVGDREAMDAAFAKTDNVKLHLMAAGALVRQGDEDALAAIREAYKTGDDDSIQIGAWLLARVGDESDIPLLKSRIGEVKDDPVIHAYVNHALATLGDPEGKAALAENLNSDDGPIRTYAATFAGDAGMKEVTPRLIEMLDDPHPDAAYRAAQSLLFFTTGKPMPR
ncbi:MAG: hypothetical protein HKN23_14105 [Verrucomicrobiales bacterium]|nr:hypothetical protein [Verrucomicrobiales bacterium]